MAGSKRDAFETDILELLFNNTALANIGDGPGLQPSGTPGSLYVALYTVAPTDSTAGTECTYTGYARKAVARNGSNWVVAGNNCSNVNAIVFDECTGGGPETAVAFAIMTALTAGDMLYWGDITDPPAGLDINTGISPEIQANDCDVNED